ncbi:helix-turn-helix transcriptional regulator [Cellulosimicrobium composti]|uniref:helix-turn-helix transcriptional regulator n=1 Tax=Cellulosimicrobium composti TaxID=2672572 RepID=UPI003789498F
MAGTLLTLEQVANEYDIPKGTLRYYRHIGAGPKSFKLAGRVRYRREDVDAWIAAEYATAVGASA